MEGKKKKSSLFPRNYLPDGGELGSELMKFIPSLPGHRDGRDALGGGRPVGPI